MSNFSSPAGWRERTKQTREKHQARVDMADVRAIRAQAEAESAARALAESAAIEAANRAAKLSCPCCKGEGKVTVEVAELVYRALERLPSDSRPDPTILANLARISRGEAVHTHTPKLSHGLSHPAPVASANHVATTTTTARKTSKINRLTEEGALIELDD